MKLTISVKIQSVIKSPFNFSEDVAMNEGGGSYYSLRMHSCKGGWGCCIGGLSKSGVEGTVQMRVSEGYGS